MAFPFPGKAASLSVGGTAKPLDKFDVVVDGNPVEFSNFTSAGWKEFIGGLKGAKITYERTRPMESCRGVPPRFNRDVTSRSFRTSELPGRLSQSMPSFRHSQYLPTCKESCNVQPMKWWCRRVPRR